MGVMSSKYFKSMLVFAMLLFLWQPAWGLVQTADPANPKQGNGAYYEDFNNYVSGATGELQFVMAPTTGISWAIFDTTKGILQMAGIDQPENKDVGSQITITVTDLGGSDPASVEFVLTVENENDLPVFKTDLTGQTLNAIEEAVFSYEVLVEDIDILAGIDEVLTPSLSTNAPSWLKVTAGNPATDGSVALTLSGTPNEELSLGGDKTYTDLTISVNDSKGRVVSPLFNISVAAVDDSPKISGTPPATAKQGSTYSFKPVYTDADTANLTYALTIDGNPPADGFWLQIGNDGTVSGTPGNNDVGVVNNVVISVSDDTTKDVSLAPYNITVENKNDIPEIDAIRIGNNANIDTVTPLECTTKPCTIPIPAQNIDQVVQLPQTPVVAGDAYLIQLNISDIDIDINAQAPTDISYSFLGLPGWIEMNYPNTADHRILQLRNLPNRPNNDDVGKYSNIQILVTDGMGGVVKTALFSIEVANSNDKPFFTQTPIAVVGINEDSPVMFTPTGSAVTNTTIKVNKVKADDIDLKYGDTLVYSLDPATKPSWLGIDSATGVFTGVPRAVDVGQYPSVKIIVTDAGDLIDEYSFALIVKAVNDLPVFTQAPPKDQTIQINAGLAFPSGLDIIKATDEDSTDVPADSVTFTLKEGAPAWLSVSYTGKEGETFLGKISGTPTNADAGTSDVIIIAKDNSGAETEWPFKVEVIYVNKPPVISKITTAIWNEDSYKEIKIPVTDDVSDNPLDILTPTMENAPAWLSYRMDGMNVILSGTPQAKDNGLTNGVKLTVKDGSTPPGTDSITFTVEVIPVNDAPVITGSLPIGEIGKAYYFKPVVTDEEGDAITFGFSFDGGKPEWLSIDYFTGAITGTPDAANTYPITITAYDGEGQDSLTAVLKVIDPAAEIAKGDVNADETVDLADAILVLQVMAGISPSDSITVKADVNADGKLGLEDVIYIMTNLTAVAL